LLELIWELRTVQPILQQKNRRGNISLWEVEISQITHEGIEKKERLIPSCVFFEQGNIEPYVGMYVRELIDRKAGLPITEVKLKMGTPHSYETDDGNRYSPEDISSLILKKIADSVEEMGDDLLEGDVVVTIPASFDMAQRWATKKACFLAGIRNPKLLEEPKAALLDFVYTWLMEGPEGKDSLEDDFFTKPKLVMVYDFGGGTLDVSLHIIEAPGADDLNLIIEDIAIGRYTELGGGRIDRIIRDKLRPQFYEDADLEEKDFFDNIAEDNRLLQIAENIKIKISDKYREQMRKTGKRPDNISISYTGAHTGSEKFTGFDVLIEKSHIDKWIGNFLTDSAITFDKMKEMSQQNEWTPPGKDTFLGPVCGIFEQFYLGKAYERFKNRISLWQKPDLLLLNGGMSFYPTVEEELEKFFGKKVKMVGWTKRNFAVSRGACIYNLLLKNRQMTRSVLSESYYFRVSDKDGKDEVIPIIEAGSPFDLQEGLQKDIGANLVIPKGEQLISIQVFKKNMDGQKEPLIKYEWPVAKSDYERNALVKWEMDHDKTISVSAHAAGASRWETWEPNVVKGQQIEKIEKKTVGIPPPIDRYAAEPLEMSASSNRPALDVSEELKNWKNVIYSTNISYFPDITKHSKEKIEPKILSSANWMDFIEHIINHLNEMLDEARLYKNSIKCRHVFLAMSRFLITLYRLCIRLKPTDPRRTRATVLIANKLLAENEWQYFVRRDNEKIYLNQVCSSGIVGLGMISSCNPNSYGIIKKSVTAPVSEGSLLEIINKKSTPKGLRLTTLTALGKCGAAKFIDFAGSNYPNPITIRWNESLSDYDPQWRIHIAWAIGRAGSRLVSNPMPITDALEASLKQIIQDFEGGLSHPSLYGNALFAIGQVLDACPDIPAEYIGGERLRNYALRVIENSQTFSEHGTILNGTLGRLRGEARLSDGEAATEYARSEAVFLKLVTRE